MKPEAQTTTRCCLLWLVRAPIVVSAGPLNLADRYSRRLRSVLALTLFTFFTLYPFFTHIICVTEGHVVDTKSSECVITPISATLYSERKALNK